MRWFCLNCGAELKYDAVARVWWCPKCDPEYTKSGQPLMDEKIICDTYVEGFKDGYNRAMDDMNEGIKR